MSEVADRTAYYLNFRVPAVALIGEGVRFPAGQWRWVAPATAASWHVEEMLSDMFPALRRTQIKFATLLSEFDVNEFEASLAPAR